MKYILTFIAIFIIDSSFCQELDIFQNDSIYSKNQISNRTMYVTNNGTIQKEMITYYDQQGKLIRRSWFWNGETIFHNSESFFYDKQSNLTNVIDSFTDGNIETTHFYYTNSDSKYSFTLDRNNDTVYYNIYPGENIEIKRWYRDGKPYRYDTTIYEKENVKIEYYGIDNLSWHYKFKNAFDGKGNLLRTEFNSKIPGNTFTRYIYDYRGLLISKEEILSDKKREKVLQTTYFTYE